MGIKVPIENVLIFQRDIMRKANIWAKPVITATHLLESMTEERVQTRAVVSGLAHAVLGRVDAVMLSGETAVGHDPVGAVQMMNGIIRKAETRLPQQHSLEVTSPHKKMVEMSVIPVIMQS